MTTSADAERKLEQQLLLGRRIEGDRLLLADAVLAAALDGSRALTGAEQAALRASPLTLRRFRHLSLERARQAQRDAWQGSAGMLRAASSGAVTALRTDDGHWTLHFLEHEALWRVILVLDASAPFAARLLREQPLLRVLDGGGAIVLQGSLDADGECETSWPFETAPGPHFQQFGAAFAVEPVRL
ncbi:hypothetical protein [Massilia sp. CF038]|uniref:hypothetical protein n=1 Tax=Massilia sp. CF038 TaxID=1881045 RepID=UPI0009234A27|nr:hypothetical protein [Massilia sp. CF038]SHG99134.1 hypothetical protein SAMN05428948_2216 [Massilia sp. CF038]